MVKLWSSFFFFFLRWDFDFQNGGVNEKERVVMTSDDKLIMVYYFGFKPLDKVSIIYNPIVNFYLTTLMR